MDRTENNQADVSFQALNICVSIQITRGEVACKGSVGRRGSSKWGEMGYNILKN